MPRTLQYFVAFTGMGTLFAGTLLLAALALGGAPARANDAAETPAPTPVAQPDDAQVLGTLEVRSFDLGFEPTAITVDQPGRYEVVFTNDGALPHDLVFADGTATPVIEGGESATIEVVIPAEGLAFICAVPGHEAAGMTGQVTVANGQNGHDGDYGNGAPAAGVIDPDPNAAPYELYDATAPERLSGEVHEIEIVMTEREMTVADGFVQKVWTFGDTVPGPVIRAKVGDLIRVTLVNPPENEVPHSIDFHASLVAWNDEMRSINPGEELVYEFEAKYAGVYMYHCGTSPALHHIANGMYGMIIIEPADGLPEVDHEFALVQSEWYLGPQGDLTDLAKASESAPSPDFVVFNGVANQYLDHPIEVGVDETVRVFVLNAGPSVDSSFHVVGTIFHDVIKEGFHLREGNEGNWGAQAVDLSPAQGAIVEMRFDFDGLYPIVTHAFNFVGKGALGLFMAGDGGPGVEDGAGH
jgi:nitrite reductase (NO-forming)